MTRLALFDCDGTLVDSAANICLAVERCFDAHRLTPPPRPAIHRIVGLSLTEAMAVLHPTGEPTLHAILAQSYKDTFRAMRDTPDFAHEPLYPGIAEAIDTLSSRQWRLGVATGKSDRGLALILAAHGLSDRFVTLQTADRHPSKPHPAMALAAIAEAGATPETTVVIGDTSFDMRMAAAAGAHAVGVDWGYHAPHELAAAGAAEIVSDARRLPDVLLALVERAPRVQTQLERGHDGVEFGVGQGARRERCRSIVTDAQRSPAPNSARRRRRSHDHDPRSD